MTVWFLCAANLFLAAMMAVPTAYAFDCSRAPLTRIHLSRFSDVYSGGRSFSFRKVRRLKVRLHGKKQNQLPSWRWGRRRNTRPLAVPPGLPYWATSMEDSSSESDDSTLARHRLPRLSRFLQLQPHPVVQLAVVLLLYTWHLVVATQGQVVWPLQWWAFHTNGGGSSSSTSSIMTCYRHFCGIGYDSILGMLTLGFYWGWWRTQRWQHHHQETLSNEGRREPPWNFPTAESVASILASSSSSSNNSNNNISSSTRQKSSSSSPSKPLQWRLLQQNWPSLLHRTTFLLTSGLLVTAYFATGRLSLFWEDLLYDMSAAGWPLTTPQFRAWTVLLGHLSWVSIGTLLLALLPRAPRFFARATTTVTTRETVAAPTATTPRGASTKIRPQNKATTWRWFRWNIRHSHWWCWVIGGYFVSSWFFNMADWANHYLLPAQVLAEPAESVVSQLVAPEHNDWVASCVGYVAPCLSAPIWEEILYRGFFLPGLTHWTGNFHLAAVIQAIVFSAHHMSVSAALPLFVLGWTWAVLYLWSGNLWTVCLVHALWNSRVFLGSWLGL